MRTGTIEIRVAVEARESIVSPSGLVVAIATGVSVDRPLGDSGLGERRRAEQ
jgi:hypothetical protein